MRNDPTNFAVCVRQQRHERRRREVTNPTDSADATSAATIQNATNPPAENSAVLPDATSGYNPALQSVTQPDPAIAEPAESPTHPFAEPMPAALALSHAQQHAIELLALGRSDQAVANIVRVHRVTVTRWRLYHPVSAAELNRRRHEVWGAAGDRFRSMLERAFDVFDQQLLARQEEVCLRAARTLINMAGSNKFAPRGLPTEPRSIIDHFVRFLRGDLLDDNPISDDDRRHAMREMLQRLNAPKDAQGPEPVESPLSDAK